MGWGGGQCWSVSAEVSHTSALAVRPPQDPALLDLAEGGEHHPDLVLAVLLGHHADEELPVFHRCEIRKEKGGREGVNRQSFNARAQTITGAMKSASNVMRKPPPHLLLPSFSRPLSLSPASHVLAASVPNLLLPAPPAQPPGVCFSRLMSVSSIGGISQIPCTCPAPSPPGCLLKPLILLTPDFI